MLLVSAFLRALVCMGATPALTRVTDQALRAYEGLDADRPLPPAEELIIYELASARAKLLLKTNIISADRDEKLERQLSAWARLRDRLIRHWPYDPRGGLPRHAPANTAELHDAVVDRLEEARSLTIVSARKQDVPPPAEP